MTVPQASMLTRAFVSLSPFSFSPFLSLPCQPQSLTAILLFFYLKKHLFSFPLCVSHSLGLPSPYVLSCLPLHLLSPLHVPPTHTLPISWFPQLLVRGRLRWLTESEMDEVSAQRWPNGILTEQHQWPTPRRPVILHQVWWHLYTVVPLLESTEDCSVLWGGYRLISKPSLHG